MSLNNIAVVSDLIGFTGISEIVPENTQIQRKTDTIRKNQNDFVYLKSNQNKSEILQPCIIHAKVSQ